MQLNMIMVWPTSQTNAKVLKHPTAGGFSSDVNEPAVWPLDQFTLRRLADGSVTREGRDTPRAKAKPKAKA